MRQRRRGTALAILAILAVPAFAACSSDPAESATDLLARARTTLDDTRSVHFVLESTGAPATGTVLLGGMGDLARPASFSGTLRVQAVGSAIDVNAVSVDGTVYAQLPFQQTYSIVDPAQFGVGDPGALLDPDTGISPLLTSAEDAKLGKEKRVGGEVVREVTAQLPGDLVAQALTSKEPSQPVQARLSIATDSGQLRRVELTGPFFTAGDDATYTLELSDFGADVQITAPPTG
ncbi:lipoprotein LprG [Modestobacter sp. DSM 44400]|uniref:LppX_LprAFG lipoprotein n=1 Tax=Modestobacter sp. DSM 44400 TaxID=1550230 RepID=UPI00089C6427|nr:LppX_LprAFG lipoprotein [Modestobacter sp. DSM 44400]SDY08116.1 lipoprotein LprG [Modestobacter sp. DSM 44400]